MLIMKRATQNDVAAVCVCVFRAILCDALMKGARPTTAHVKHTLSFALLHKC